MRHTTHEDDEHVDTVHTIRLRSNPPVQGEKKPEPIRINPEEGD